MTGSHGSGAGKSETCRAGAGWRPREELMLQVGSDISLKSVWRQNSLFFGGRQSLSPKAFNCFDEAHPHQESGLLYSESADLHVNYIYKMPSK